MARSESRGKLLGLGTVREIDGLWTNAWPNPSRVGAGRDSWSAIPSRC